MSSSSCVYVVHRCHSLMGHYVIVNFKPAGKKCHISSFFLLYIHKLLWWADPKMITIKNHNKKHQNKSSSGFELERVFSEKGVTVLHILIRSFGDFSSKIIVFLGPVDVQKFLSTVISLL